MALALHNKNRQGRVSGGAICCWKSQFFQLFCLWCHAIASYQCFHGYKIIVIHSYSAPPPFPLQSPSLVKLILVFEISFMKFSNCKKFRQSTAGYIKFCTDTSTSGDAWVHAVHLASVVPLASPTSVAAEGFYFFFWGGGAYFQLSWIL